MRHAFLIAVLALTGCQDDPATRQVAYFKDDAGNRVFVLQATDAADDDALRDALSGLAHTAGRVTQGFMLPTGPDAYIDNVTVAADYMAALDRAYSGPGWILHWLKGPDGRETLTDCGATPEADTCPK